MTSGGSDPIKELRGAGVVVAKERHCLTVRLHGELVAILPPDLESTPLALQATMERLLSTGLGATGG